MAIIETVLFACWTPFLSLKQQQGTKRNVNYHRHKNTKSIYSVIYLRMQGQKNY